MAAYPFGAASGPSITHFYSSYTSQMTPVNGCLNPVSAAWWSHLPTPFVGTGSLIGNANIRFFPFAL